MELDETWHAPYVFIIPHSLRDRPTRPLRGMILGPLPSAWPNHPRGRDHSHMGPHPLENCDLAVWLLPLIVIALGTVDRILFLERS